MVCRNLVDLELNSYSLFDLFIRLFLLDFLYLFLLLNLNFPPSFFQFFQQQQPEVLQHQFQQYLRSQAW